MSADGISPRKAPRQRRSRRTVDRIVEAAARVFDDAGYLGATTNEIAAEAGVSIGSLYQYFPNKDALLVEIAHRHVSASVAALDELLTGLGRRHSLNDVTRRVVELLVGQHEHDRMHLLIAHQAPRTPELDDELDRAHRHLVGIADTLLREQVPDDGQRLLAAQLVVAVLHAAIHDVILRRPRGRERDAAVALTVSTVAAITGARRLRQ